MARKSSSDLLKDCAASPGRQTIGSSFKLKEVLRIKGAVKFVSVQGFPIRVDEKVIASLKHLVREDMQIDPFPYLSTGVRVSVCTGIFKGIEGYILRKDDQKCRLVISIDAMMASVSVEVDSCLVEKV